MNEIKESILRRGMNKVAGVVTPKIIGDSVVSKLSGKISNIFNNHKVKVLSTEKIKQGVWDNIHKSESNLDRLKDRLDYALKHTNNPSIAKRKERLKDAYAALTRRKLEASDLNYYLDDNTKGYIFTPYIKDEASILSNSKIREKLSPAIRKTYARSK